jgi:hypothetical protein
MKINPFAANLFKFTLIIILLELNVFAYSTNLPQSVIDIRESSMINESVLLSKSDYMNENEDFVIDFVHHQKKSAEYFFWLNGNNETTDDINLLNCDLCWHLFIDTLTMISSFDEESLYILEIL